jgi:hypothetical protein
MHFIFIILKITGPIGQYILYITLFWQLTYTYALRICATPIHKDIIPYMNIYVISNSSGEEGNNWH